MKRRFQTGLFLLLSAIPALSDSADSDASSSEIRGTIDSVTVYRGQALVTRSVAVPGPGGLREVVVTDLPDRVVAGSLFAEAGKGLAVRSVRFRNRPAAQDVREEVRKLDAAIRDEQDKLYEVEKQRQVMADFNGYLAKLEGFVAPAANAELKSGVLNAETLKALSTFLLEQRTRLAREDVETGRRKRDHDERIAHLSQQRQTIAGNSARTLREAVVFVNVEEAAGGNLLLRYLVDGASWAPSYNVRRDESSAEVRLEYMAVIQQMSGEDWPGVEMTLSTATPLLVARAPTLAPLSVSLSAAQAEQIAQKAEIRSQLAAKQVQLEQARNMAYANAAPAAQTAEPDGAGGARGSSFVGLISTGITIQPTWQFDKLMNDNACEVQLIDLVSVGRVSKARDASSLPLATEGMSVCYRLPSRTSLPSRDDQQLVQIAAASLKGDFYKIATPVLTSYVYNEAVLTNSSSLVLLAGPVATYVGGQFVGHGELPTVTVGERFTLGLGIDASVRASRELVERTESPQGGNRVVEFTYKLALENFGELPAVVRVVDRIPTGRDAELKVTLLGGDGELSQDPTYVQGERKKGLLRWELEAPARKFGLDSRAIEYKFKVEYDKGMTLAGINATN